MFIKVKGETSNKKGEDVSYVNTDFVQKIIGTQVQMADGTVHTLEGSLEDALAADPQIKILNTIATNISNIKLTIPTT